MHSNQLYQILLVIANTSEKVVMSFRIMYMSHFSDQRETGCDLGSENPGSFEVECAIVPKILGLIEQNLMGLGEPFCAHLV